MKHDLALSMLETEICRTIEHIGWHAHLWFPIVDRHALKFFYDATDPEIHTAIVGLIRKRALIYADPDGWRPPNFSAAPDVRRQILPSPGYMALRHRMPSVTPGPVEKTLEVAPHEPRTSIARPPMELATPGNITLTELEAQIVQSVEHVGWYSYLWFPVVAREALNFGSNDPEEVVHDGIVGLIQKGLLVAAQDESGDFPQWSPAPGVLSAAEDKMREMLRTSNPNPWPDRFSERFHIFAHGETFDVDAFLRASTLRPSFVWRNLPSKTSGIEIFLGDGRQIRLVDQEDIAVDYLNAQKDQLTALAQFPGVDTFILGLVRICTPEQTGFCVGPPPELMRQALQIGICPLYYCAIDGRGTHLRSENV